MRFGSFHGLIAGAVGLMLLTGSSSTASAQSSTVITGRVVSEAGSPVVGATISVEATQFSATTGADGRYTLVVPGTKRGPAEVSLRLIGYKLSRKSVTLAGTPASIDWTMAAQVTQLTGITVTALSIQREKTTIGTSQQTLDGA